MITGATRRRLPTREACVARAGREHFEIAHNQVDGVIMATPAISDGLIIIRTMGHVYGFGEKPDSGRRNR